LLGSDAIWGIRSKTKDLMDAEIEVENITHGLEAVSELGVENYGRPAPFQSLLQRGKPSTQKKTDNEIRAQRRPTRPKGGR